MADDVLELIDGHPFRDALKNAVEIRWSGLLRAVKDSRQVGVVVMKDGHIAWAVSNSQTENFGSFLERIGMVPREKLTEVVHKYRSLGKSKKLGALLEEAGLLSRCTLRECLKAHVSAALSSLMADPGVLLEARHGEMAIDASHVFLLGEVFPEDENRRASLVTGELERSVGAESREESPCGPESAFLQELSSAPGYLYSLVADTGGRIHSLHQSDGIRVETDRVVAAVCDWLDASYRLCPATGLGAPRFTLLTCEQGSIFVQVVDADCERFVALVCDGTARTGVVMHKITEVVSAIRENSGRL
ncbi:MAG: hypothetical protein GYA56_11545 [Geobacteraceae bacterium]|nr:hypothetical protein [Geobacteraceae bacterium]